MSSAMCIKLKKVKFSKVKLILKNSPRFDGLRELTVDKKKFFKLLKNIEIEVNQDQINELMHS